MSKLKSRIANYDFEPGMIKYQYSLLLACEELHMFLTGANDISRERAIELRNEIERRLNSWTNSIFKYDEYVRRLCLTNIKDYNSWEKKTNE